MAVLFEIPLDENMLLYSGVNNIIRFYSDSTTSPVQKAEISFFNSGAPITKIIYPGPSQKFFYNFSEFITAVINKTDFDDNINYSQAINDWTQKIYLREAITIKIYFEDTTFESTTLDTSWLAAYFQYGDKNFSIQNKTAPLILKNKSLIGTPYIKYWKGYPFTIGFYTGGFDGLRYTITVYAGLLPAQTFIKARTVTRLTVTDGYATFLNVPQSITLCDAVINEFSNNFWLHKITPLCTGRNLYIKWLNQWGDYDFWLFNIPDEERSTKSLGYVNNDFSNFIDTVTPAKHLGWTGVDVLTVYDTFSAQDMTTLKELFISPKIYMFTGTPGASSTDADWLTIKLKAGSRETRSRKNQNTQLKLEFEMPELLTRKL